jgi:small GTP-binding protein
MIGYNKQKCVFIGQSGVGKSTLLSLVQGEKDLENRNPTIGVAIEQVSLDENNKTTVWDLAGQDRFQFMWDDFIKGAGLTVIITDSTEENINFTKEICNRYTRFRGSKVIAIANKQDLPGAMNIQNVADKLGVKTYGMCAIDPSKRSDIRAILRHELGLIF